MSTHELKVEQENNRERIDVFLTHSLPDIPSRSFIKRLIDSGCVLLNNEEVNAHHKVSLGDSIRVNIPQDFLKPKHIDPEPIRLDIFYEDEYIIVINKPVGLLVHPTSSRTSGTLVNALLHYCDQLSDVNTVDRPGIVHRLDQETSGLMVVAKTNKAHAKLAKQFAKQRVKKIYVALVEGEVEFDEGVVDAPLKRHLKHHDKRAVEFDDAAKEATTVYHVIKRHQGVSYISLAPKTGRMHQLRVHMKYLGHPILGDEKYGRKDSFSRLALHAKSLGFTHPESRKWIEFSSKAPQEFLEKVILK